MGPVRLLIAGEPYSVEAEGDLVFLVHPRWSLLGAGPTLPEAYSDLLKRAADIVRILARWPADELDNEGQKMFRFAKNLLAHGA